MAKALVHEMPHTLAALEAGALSEWRATILVRESACLDVEDRGGWTQNCARILPVLRAWVMRRWLRPPRRLPTGLIRMLWWTGLLAPSRTGPSPSAQPPTP